MARTNHERYIFAEQLYCFTDTPMHEIAEITQIPERSLYQRARDYKWATLRRASRRSPMVICEEMYRELSDITATINSRPEGHRIPTQSEADLRRKILTSIAAIKKFPTHAEVLFIMQSLIRYSEHFHYDYIPGLQNLIDCFLAHRDVYGFASYQPEHNQELNIPTEAEQENEDNFRDPYETSTDINRFPDYRNPQKRSQPEIITKFKTHSEPFAGNGLTG